MSRRSTVSIFAFAALSVAAFGCGANAPTASEQSALGSAHPIDSEATGPRAAPVPPEAKDERAAKPPRLGRHGPHGPGGPLALFEDALRKVELSDPQMTRVKSAIRSAHDGNEVPRAKERALMKALLEGVAAGHIDETAIRSQIDGVLQDAAMRVDEHATALNSVHEILPAAQRQQLLTLIRKRLQNHDRRRAGAPPSDFDGPPRDDVTTPEGAFRGRGPGIPGGPGLAFALRELTLTPAQETAIDASVKADRPKRLEHIERLSPLLDAFAGDHFDARTVLDPKQVTERMRKRWTHEIALAQTLVRVLTPEQRATFAAIAEHPERHRGRPRTMPRTPKTDSAEAPE